MRSVKDRFLQYIQVETTSDENSTTCPSSPKEWDLIRMLEAELKSIGVQHVRCTEHGYVYGFIPAKGNHPEKIGLIAHMDTSDGVRGATHPVIMENYDGKPYTLANGTRVEGFDFLPSLAGQNLIVTDGTSVLGADDKAGVAEIMTLAELLCSPSAPEHCAVCIGFTPDEEIGRGADLFDVEGFGANFAYTVDGGAVGELEYENFNAAACEIIIHGRNIHPGSAKNRMKNALLIAMDFNSMLPPWETPAHTEGREGFFHLCHMTGDEELDNLRYLIRDHSRDSFNARKKTMEDITAYLNSKYGEGTVEAHIRDSYYNMLEMIEPHMEIVERAKRAFLSCGIEPAITPVRGGTDGARLSYMGLPCPNLSTGGYNFHSREELITVQALEKMTEVLLALVQSF